jgi:signal transduction histidine kinase
MPLLVKFCVRFITVRNVPQRRESANGPLSPAADGVDQILDGDIGEGTGLGLSISWDIVTQQHGGSITVDSREGEFKEFTIRLPRNGQADRGSCRT